jgi:hypothetical protein
VVWEAIHCDRKVSPEALTAGICQALGITPDDLSLADTIDQADQSARVLVAARSRPGDFPMTVDIISGDEELEERIDDDSLRAMCIHWGCRGLLSDGGDNPYRMLLVGAEEAGEAVYIEVRAFDDREEIILVGPASTIPAPKIPEGPRSQRRSTPPPPGSGHDAS